MTRLVIIGLVLGAAVAAAQYVEATVNVGAGPVALAFDSTRNKLFTANRNAHTVAVLDAGTLQRLAVVRVGQSPNDVLVQPGVGKVYVTCAPVSGGNGRVYIMDASSHGLIDSVEVGPEPMKMVWDRTDNTIQVLNRLGPSLSVIDCNSNQVVGFRRLIQVPEDIIWNHVSNKVYVTSGYYMQPGRVFIINAATQESIAVVTAGQDGYRLAFNPVDNRVYSGNKGNRTLTIIDGAANTVIRTVNLPGEPWAMSWVPQNKVFIGNYFNGTMSFLRGGELALAGTFPGTANPYCLTYNPNTLKLFSACYLTARVAVVDVRNGHEDVHDSITVGNGPADIVVFPDSNRVFVANSWDSTVTVIRDYVGITEPETPAYSTVSAARPSVCRPGATVRLDAQRVAVEVRDASGRIVFHGRDGAWPVPSGTAAGVYFCRRAGSVARVVVE